MVRGLDFVGNHAIDNYTLSTVIATTNSSAFASYWWLRWMGLGAKRYFDELEFRRDVVRLILYYRQSGYMRVVVDTAVRRTPRDVFVTFRIYEGEPVRVRKLELEGLGAVVDERALRRALPLRVGDTFNRFLFQAVADTMTAWFRNRGYPYAQVLRNFDANADSLTADLRFEAVPGTHYRVGEVLVRGLERVQTSTVLRIVSVRPGDPYREEQLYRSQRDLYVSGPFRSASVALLDTVPPAEDSTVRVLVTVAEGPRRRVRFGGGYGTLDCFRAQTGWSTFGFLGDVRVLDLSARVSKIGVGRPLNAGFADNVCGVLKDDTTFSGKLNYSAGLTLFQSLFLSPRHTASIGVLAERRSEPKTYRRTQVGGNVGVTINARRRIPVGVSYGYSVGRTDADPASFCKFFNVCDLATQASLSTSHPFAALTVSGARRTEDFALDPTTGSHVGATLVHSSRVLGSDRLYEFNRGELEIAQYFPVGRHGVFSWRVHAGELLPARITQSGQSVQFVPPDQRFYGGGPNSVRGYGANELGPRVYVVTDTTDTLVQNGDTIYRNFRTVPTGGNSILLANVELRVPGPVFPDRLRLAAFVDVGQVYERQNKLVSFEAVRVTPGVGFRVTTPLGPVRVDLAYNGYGKEPGTLWFQDPKTNDLVKIRDSYQQKRPAAFLRRLALQFAIGQAF